MSGILLVVATPIGNLADLSPRALEALRGADLILAEDTRRTRGLLTHHDIRRPLESFDAHKEHAAATRIVERIRQGTRVALVTDAGTPGLSDPGGLLVREVLEAGLTVSPIPGPSAVAAAVSAAGVESAFRFDGFLPRKGGERTRSLERLRESDVPVVLFESPQRLGATLAELAAALPGRSAVVCRELTKLHEEIVSGTLESLASRFSGEVLGELTLVVFPPPSPLPSALPALRPEALASRLLAEGIAPSRVARIVSDLLGLPHKEAYRLALDEDRKASDQEPTTKNQ
jgi:16S rRNA (cytidine1402-2'-O)-methyltransferase